MPGYRLVGPRRLGHGGCAEVWKAVGPDGTHVALKFIHLDGNAAALEQRSLNLFDLRKIRHENLLPLLSSPCERDGYLILTLELGECTLLDRLKEARAAGSVGIPPTELLAGMRDPAGTGLPECPAHPAPRRQAAQSPTSPRRC
jgi:hypothetical protein